jgi:hypothetical protein
VLPFASSRSIVHNLLSCELGKRVVSNLVVEIAWKSLRTERNHSKCKVQRLPTNFKEESTSDHRTVKGSNKTLRSRLSFLKEEVCIGVH